MSTKTCARCSNAKPHEEFHRDSRRPDGLNPYCKACRSRHYPADPQRTARYREANRDGLRTAQSERHRIHRDRLNALKLTLSCVDCGWQPETVDDVSGLEFDHIDPATKHAGTDRAAVYVSWSWPRIEAEIAKCEPRCKACHLRRTAAEGHNLRRASA